MDSVMPALLRVTTGVLTLGQLAQAGDEQAAAQLEAWAAQMPEPR